MPFDDFAPRPVRYTPKQLRIRAGLLVGRLSYKTLTNNARHATDHWIRECCRLELERRKELENG